MNTTSTRRVPHERTTGPHGKEGEGEKKVKVKVNRVAPLAAERHLRNACARRRSGGRGFSSEMDW